MPRVTVGSPPRLRALPIAMTSSPTWRSSEEPSSAGTRSSSRSCTWMSATSSSGTRPRGWRGCSLPSGSTTVMSPMLPITWALVSTRPSALSTIPEPAPSNGPSCVVPLVSTATTDGWTLARIAWMSSAPSLVVTGVMTGRSTEVGGVVVERDGDARRHQGGDHGARQGAEERGPARAGARRRGVGGGRRRGRVVERAVAAGRPRPGRRHRRAGRPAGARRCGRRAAPRPAGARSGRPGSAVALGRARHRWFPSPHPRRPEPAFASRGAQLTATSQVPAVPGSLGNQTSSRLRTTRAAPPERQAPWRWTPDTSGWREGSARASHPPRSSRATVPGSRWPARSARTAP